MTTQNVFTMHKWNAADSNGLKDALAICQRSLSKAVNKHNISSGVVAIEIAGSLAELTSFMKCRLIIDADYDEYEKSNKELNSFFGENISIHTLEEFLNLKGIEI